MSTQQNPFQVSAETTDIERTPHLDFILEDTGNGELFDLDLMDFNSEYEAKNPHISLSHDTYKERYDYYMSRVPDLGDGENVSDRVHDLVRTEEGMRALEATSEKTRFAASKDVWPFAKTSLWRVGGFSSFSEYFNDPETPFSKSSAYRYSAVGEFMESFPLDNLEFIRDFRDQFNLGFTPVFHQDGKMDHDETIRLNALICPDGHIGSHDGVIRFLQVYNLASLTKKGKINSADTLELLRDAMLDTEEQWKRRIKSLGSNVSNTDDDLEEDGFDGGVMLLIPVNDMDQTRSYLRSLLETLEGSNPPDLLNLANKVDQKNPDTGKYYGTKSGHMLRLSDDWAYPDDSSIFLTRISVNPI